MSSCLICQGRCPPSVDEYRCYSYTDFLKNEIVRCMKQEEQDERFHSTFQYEIKRTSIIDDLIPIIWSYLYDPSHSLVRILEIKNVYTFPKYEEEWRFSSVFLQRYQFCANCHQQDIEMMVNQHLDSVRLKRIPLNEIDTELLNRMKWYQTVQDHHIIPLDLYGFNTYIDNPKYWSLSHMEWYEISVLNRWLESIENQTKPVIKQIRLKRIKLH